MPMLGRSQHSFDSILRIFIPNLLGLIALTHIHRNICFEYRVVKYIFVCFRVFGEGLRHKAAGRQPRCCSGHVRNQLTSTTAL